MLLALFWNEVSDLEVAKVIRSHEVASESEFGFFHQMMLSKLPFSCTESLKSNLTFWKMMPEYQKFRAPEQRLSVSEEECLTIETTDYCGEWNKVEKNKNKLQKIVNSYLRKNGVLIW
ncbi:hypothetical protein KQX54_005535 [Cotesia glomerata]|uniref:Uncharacterized protein n=1 Tax=Cotesia glomerata TaxID=32391 RepID=A0AAV7HTX8_COTGL|nr:hypothetical protein KQX54_005535 [Cotesia glomerata]